MRLPLVTALLLACSLLVSAAEKSPSSKIQEGRRSTAHLLATARISGKGAPDGVRFLFLVVPKPGVSGQFAITETRDFQLDGKSYQEKSQAALGKRIEPATMLDDAEKFFTKQPGLRSLAPENIKGAHIVTVAIAGAELGSGAAGEITLQVGFAKEVEPFTFRFAVPPGKPAAKKS